MRAFVMLYATLVWPMLTHAEGTIYSLHCAAVLEDAVHDPGPKYARTIFAGLADRAWRQLSGEFPFGPMVALSARALGPDDEITMSDVLRHGFSHFGGGSLAFATALRRLSSDAGHAASNSVFRNLVVGRDAIRAHLEKRAAIARRLQAEFDAIPTGPARQAPTSKLKLAAHAILAPAALAGLWFGSTFLYSSLRGGDVFNAAGELGVVAMLLPVLRVTLTNLYVASKQGAIDRGWIESPQSFARASFDEASYSSRVLEMIEANQRGAFLYRSLRADVPFRRGEAKFPFLVRQSLPSVDELVARVSSAKGRARAVDQRTFGNDEVVIYDEARRDWILLGLTFED